MSSDFSALKPAQFEWAEKIAVYGKKNQYPQEVTSAVLMLAHQESDLNRYRHNLSGSSASGLFHFMGPEHIKDELAGYREHHPDGPYANWSARQVFNSDEATIAVMFDKVDRWKQEFNQGYLPERMEHKLHRKPGLEEQIHQDFNSYAFFRHNTSIKQTGARVFAEEGILISNQKIAAFVNDAYSQQKEPYRHEGPADAVKEFRYHVASVREPEAAAQRQQQIQASSRPSAPNASDTAHAIVEASGFRGTSEERAKLTQLVGQNLAVYNQTQMPSSVTGQSEIDSRGQNDPSGFLAMSHKKQVALVGRMTDNYLKEHPGVERDSAQEIVVHALLNPPRNQERDAESSHELS